MQKGRQLLDNCKGLQHIGIPADNLDKTCDFYTDLGFRKVFETRILEGQRVVFLEFRGLTLECYEGSCIGQAGAIDHIAIDCADVETAYAYALEKKYPIISDGIEELPFWKNGVRFFIIEGPDKVKIELNQYL